MEIAVGVRHPRQSRLSVRLAKGWLALPAACALNAAGAASDADLLPKLGLDTGSLGNQLGGLGKLL
jgi:hypothetical protein